MNSESYRQFKRRVIEIRAAYPVTFLELRLGNKVVSGEQND